MTDQFEQTFLLFIFALIIVGLGWVALYIKIRSVELAINSLVANDVKQRADLNTCLGRLQGELAATKTFVMDCVAKLVQAVVNGVKDSRTLKDSGNTT
jgi:hypothetical protein